MKRRAFITLLGGAAAAWPLAARAQQSARLPTIGFLGANTPSAQSQWTAAFERRLRELGWIEGRNVAIEYRWAETRFERSPEIIAEFIRSGGGSGRQQPRRWSGATGRQRHWPVGPDTRSCRQASRTLA